MATVLIEDARPHVKVLTLNRPERLNALSLELVGALHDALDVVASDAECRVAVITGAGRGFCSGLDLKDLGDLPKPGEHRRVRVGMGVQEFIAELPIHMRETPQILIAAVNGPAFGGGLSIALSADIRIAGESASFCSAYIRTGLSGTDIGVSYFLPRLVGASRGFEMIVTGRAVDADEADRMGLVSRVVPQERLLDEALETATTIASYSRTGLILTKEAMWANLEAPNLHSALALENRNQNIASRSGEIQEYMKAFGEKRRADFSGDQSPA